MQYASFGSRPRPYCCSPCGRLWVDFSPYPASIRPVCICDFVPISGDRFKPLSLSIFSRKMCWPIQEWTLSCRNTDTNAAGYWRSFSVSIEKVTQKSTRPISCLAYLLEGQAVRDCKTRQHALTIRHRLYPGSCCVPDDDNDIFLKV